MFATETQLERLLLCHLVSEFVSQAFLQTWEIGTPPKLLGQEIAKVTQPAATLLWEFLARGQLVET